MVIERLLPDHFEHSASLAEGWSVWRWVCLRGAGFPFAEVRSVAVEEAEPALDRWWQANARMHEARETALAACVEERSTRKHDEPIAGQLESVLERLRAGKTPKPHALYSEALTSALVALAQAVEASSTAERTARSQIDEAEARTRSALREIARESRFREALLWQNRRALDRGVDALLRQPLDATDSKTRQNERLVAAYLQRYCAKNDTIGFFGPVSWGRFADEGPALVCEPGPALLETRTVYFEYWAIDAIAQALSRDPALRSWVKPRRAPTVRVEGTVLHHPYGRADELPAELARVLAVCDGSRSARDIARELTQDPDLDLSDEAEVFELLDELVEQKLATCVLELPTPCARPLNALRQVLEDIGDESIRARALEVADQLEERRAAIERSAGDPDALQEQLARLEAAFVDRTGLGGTRHAGELYGGRTLVYEDCRRDLKLRLGPEISNRFGPALVLLLKSARWLTYTAARRFREVIDETYEKLRKGSEERALDYVVFRRELAPKLEVGGEGTAILSKTLRELQRRWEAILAIRADERGRVVRSSAELSSAVAEAFEAPGPGWPLARYHSPDLLIAAPSVDAVLEGRYYGVLGELHYGWNTQLLPPLVEQHYDPADYLRACELTIPFPLVEPLRPREFVTRADYRSYSAKDVHLETGEVRSWRERDHVVAIGELVIARVESGQLVVRTRDRRWSFDVVAFHEQYLNAICKSVGFDVLAPSDQAPRLTIDDLVVSRQRWTFAPKSIPFAHAKTRTDLIIGAHQWVRSQGLPRRVFVKIPEEEKPSFIDFLSPVLVETLAKLVRTASSVSFSEMLPAGEELWLVDREGRTYTSELRIAAVDPVPWSPAA